MMMATLLPHEIGRFANTLTHLNISKSQFSGQIPSEISLLSKLVSLDLSWNQFSSGLGPKVFNNLLRNSTRFRELSLGNVNISSALPKYLNISSLELLDLRSTGLYGKLPDNIFSLPFLEQLDLSENYGLTDALPKGEVSSSFSTCRSLKILDLGNNNLNGTFPTWLGELPELQVLNLKSNKFQGTIESSLMAELPFPSLRVLDLSQNAFVGNLPRFFGTFKAMQNITKKRIKLEYTQIAGIYYSVTLAVKGVFLPFPKISVAYTIVDLSNNMFENKIQDVIGRNLELCGFPLVRNCEGPPSPQHEEADDEGVMSGFTWKVVMIGSGGGTLFGLVMGYLMFLTRKPKWFNAIVDEQEHKIRRRHIVRFIHIGR
ncbi:hypothetical protein L1887_08999 [Cichorium endivia]|nr:hypothetical protein L1887_08999 [Cichorium endivia]